MEGGACRQTIGSATHHLYPESSSDNVHISDRIRRLQNSFEGVSHIQHDLFAEEEWLLNYRSLFLHQWPLDFILPCSDLPRISPFENFLLPIWQENT